MLKELVEDLVKIFNDNAYLSVVLSNRLETLKLTDHEKKLYTKIIYGVVENKILIDYNLSSYTKGKRIKPFMRNTLRVGAYVIDNMDVKNYYIVNELVSMYKKVDYKGSGLINAVLRNYEKSNRIDNSNLSLDIKLSIPKDLFDLLSSQYTKEEIISFFNNVESFNSYRINTLKINLEDCYNKLDELHLEYNKLPYGFICKESLINNPLFIDGFIIAQDASSMKVVEVLNPKKGSDILDVCSAPGGKSLMASAILENTGSILACDIYEEKLKKINNNALKLGSTNISTIIADATNYDYGKGFDYIICDVPCSGLGVINHKPDLKYHLNINDVFDIIKLQKDILNHVKDYVKDDGLLMYSTCTINKLENEEMIKWFINNNPSFKIIYEEQLLPSSLNDGFYICKLKKEIN